jgi:hypothetical protein
MSKFFVNRPIVAIVISILMVIGGIVALLRLPTAQFPNIADPQIQVVANYTGGRRNDYRPIGCDSYRAADGGRGWDELHVLAECEQWPDESHGGL